METINSYLPRYENSKKDDRVPDFIPDKWQVEFLDAVDKKQSIIILAPTASGKTYASYYAMESVLKQSTNSVCVYVAPTKALVNQVAATIYSRFNSPCFGLFTRDYRLNIDQCRILVTVPQCLEILLLSPNHQQWRNRIQYVIFDEIHCMSGELGADVWEKCMLMINSPMIGLSATVNNGRDLHRWWTSAEKKRVELYKRSTMREVCYITYNERLADLNKYLYSKKQLHPVHPIGLMNSRQLIERGNLPIDLILSPNETLQLHDAIRRTVTIDDGINLEGKYNEQSTTTTESKICVPSLSNYFTNDWIIERSKCNDYSRLVREQFTTMIKDKEIKLIDSVINNINQENSSLTSMSIQYPEPKQMSSLIVEFILTLRERNLLPCLVFSDSRQLCESNALSLTRYFEKEEQRLRKIKYKLQIEQIERRLDEINKNKKRITKLATAAAGKSRKGSDSSEQIINDGGDDESKNELSSIERALFYDILPECTLTNLQTSDTELANRLRERASQDNPQLVRFMKRGIAYHHAGINNKGRVAVEALFRNRYIQVVFSTSTLALGIHMPTKTVAFAMDSIYLDALAYRQASGRSGRRGFDVQGHVVFIDIPIPKIRHLTISKIPNITAHFPTSITFLMRLLHLYSMSKDDDNQKKNDCCTAKRDSCNRSLIVLECSFMSTFSMEKQILCDIQTHYHFLYSLQFLHRINLVNIKGDLVGLAGLLTHLYFYEPGNILFSYIINQELFHSTKSLGDIVIILAYMFTKLPWHLTDEQRQQLLLKRKEKKYNSKLFLPSMSKEFRQMVNEYNQIVKNIYIYYIQDVINKLREKLINQECMLPLSNISFYKTANYDNGTFEYKLKHHYTQQPSSTSISPFSGLSGLTDEIFMNNYNSTSYDLAYNIDLSNRIIPFMDIVDYDKIYLNSYAYDFFINGSERQLLNENQLQHGDIYSLLQDFLLVIASVKTSLEVIINNEQTQNNKESTTDLNFFQPLFEKIHSIHEQYQKNFNTTYNISKNRF